MNMKSLYKTSSSALVRLLFALIVLIVVMIVSSTQTSAQSLPFTPATTENPKGNSFGMEGKISAPAPTQGGRITSPSGGQTFTSPEITVSGICPTGLLVEVLNNGVMVGSTMCERGSFSVRIYLFPGQNDLSVRVLDELGQSGPASNTVTVTLSGPQFNAFGQSLTLTSAYSRRAADPGSTLMWPLQLSGGSGPYAFSIDWGDGSEIALQSQSVSGIVQIQHVYKNAGIYRVTIRVVDANGASGFLQLIAIANGPASSAIQNGDEAATETIIKYKILWWPTLIAAVLLPVAFWLGGRYQMRAYKKKLERDAAMIRKLDQ